MDDLFQRSPIASSALSILLTVDGSPGWEEALAAWVTFLNGLDHEYELLLLGERPGLNVEEAASRYARGKGLESPGAIGFGAALQRGLEAARHPLVYYARCNAHYKPSDLKALLKCIDKQDLVAGYRVFPPRSSSPKWRHLCYWLLVRGLFAVRLRDPGCLLLLARRHVFTRIPIQSQGVFAHAEVLAKANFLGCVMNDVSIACQPEAADDADAVKGQLWSDVRCVFFRPDFGPPEAKFELLPPPATAGDGAAREQPAAPGA